MPKKYIVDLSQTEQKSLQKLTRTGKQAAYKINHARILFLADINQSEGGWSDEAMKQLVKEARTPIPTHSGLVNQKDFIINMSVMVQLIYSWCLILLKDGEQLTKH